MVIYNSSLPDDHLNLATLDIDRAAWEIREENKSTEMTKKTIKFICWALVTLTDPI